LGVPGLSVLPLLSIASSSFRSVVTDRFLADWRENSRTRLRRKLVPAKLYTKKLVGDRLNRWRMLACDLDP